MRTLVKQSLSAVTQSSGANRPEWPDATWGFPITHTPIATLRLAVAWPHTPERHGIRNLLGSKTTVVLVLTAVLLAVVGTFVATTYLYGLMTQRALTAALLRTSRRLELTETEAALHTDGYR
jgi:hypothetical protein